MKLPTPSGSDVALIFTGLRSVAAEDQDRASIINGVGFSKSDTDYGRRLSRKEWLTVEEIWSAARLVLKYRRQIGNEEILAAADRVGKIVVLERRD